MEYKRIKLTEFKPTENVVFDKPKKMLVWDDVSEWSEEADVVAVLPSRERPVVAVKSAWKHCAEIPEEATPKLVTYRELSRWLAEGKGELKSDSPYTHCCTHICYPLNEANNSVNSEWDVRKWDDTEWHEPTCEYLGLEDK